MFRYGNSVPTSTYLSVIYSTSLHQKLQHLTPKGVGVCADIGTAQSLAGTNSTIYTPLMEIAATNFFFY